MILESPSVTFDASFFDGDPALQAMLNTLGTSSNTLFADTLDMSALYQDLHFTIFEISTRNLGLVQQLANQFGAFDSPVHLGMTVTLITPEDPYDSDFGKQLLPWLDNDSVSYTHLTLPTICSV